MKNVSLVLIDREEKMNKIKSFIECGFDCVTLKANIPGENKNIDDAHILVDIFNKEIQKKLNIKGELVKGHDGPMYIYEVLKGSIQKESLVWIEENHKLGRYVDIDLYTKDGIASRGVMRKCYLCDNPAFVCGREKKHPIKSLLKKVHDDIIIFLEDKLNEYINYAMEKELEISPKFGLVCKDNCGSHKDMNYALMNNAKESIVPYFKKMFECGLKYDYDEILPRIREIGLKCEKKMFKATGGINAYKGLIFILGLAVSAIGYKLKHFSDDLFDAISYISQDLVKDFEGEDKTFGMIAYKKYHILGARGEAINGLIHLRGMLDTNKLDSNEDILKGLIYLIGCVDDTVLLKRCGNLEKYYQIKYRFKYLNFDYAEINRLNEYCISKNYSFGGSADLLITGIVLKKLNEIVKIY